MSWSSRPGTLNDNYRVSSGTRQFFVRHHRADCDRDQIIAEHALVVWVGERGIPVARPLADREGRTITETADGFWSVFPWIAGRSLVRGRIGASDARALGAMHGRIQTTLAAHPRSGEQQALRWDAADSLSVLRDVEAVAIRAQADPWLLEGLRTQARMLEADWSRAPSAFGSLPSQLVHGDYHDEQMLFGRRDDIIAVVDWENARVLPRVYEVLRALALSRLTRPPLLEAYLSGYREHVRLSAEECELGVEQWWQTRLHGTWVFTAYFMEQNGRVRPFLADEVRRLAELSDRRRRTDMTRRLIRAAMD